MQEKLLRKDLEKNNIKSAQPKEKFNIQQNTQKNEDTGSACGICSVKYYRQYFKVETADVLSRIALSIIPLTERFSEIICDNPDLYGPFWIYTTLIFMLGVSGNFSTYLSLDGQQFVYNFDFLPMAFILVYSFGLVIPVIIAFIMRTFKSQTTYVTVICTYGYSMFVFIPVSLLCSIPSSTLQWVLMIYGIANSSLFLFNNLARDIQAWDKNKRYILMVFVAGSQILILLTYRLYFFSSIYTVPQTQ